MKMIMSVLAALALAIPVYAQHIRERETTKTQIHESRMKTEQRVQRSRPSITINEVARENRVNASVRERQEAEPRTRTEVQTQTTTVFRGGRESREAFRFHRGFRDRDDRHFRIGFHDRAYWLANYSTVVLIDGCWYYLDGGFYYPAYGFDPSCSYPEPAIVFEVD